MRVQNAGTLQGGVASFKIGVINTSLDLDNSGLVLGSVDLQNGAASKIVNSGVIRGDVLFWSLNDSFDGRGGSVTGTVSGQDGDDRLIGGGSDDDLSGGAGTDRIKGNGDDDTLNGGAGADRLSGGAGGDSFAFEARTDSLPTARDTVTDFRQSQGDLLDLSQIDANTKMGGDQAFTFIGTAAFTAAGQVHYVVSGDDVIVEANVNASLGADFAVLLTGVAGLVAADFVL